MRAEGQIAKGKARTEGQVQVNIGLSTEDMKGLVEILSNTLADEFVLYTKTRNYHWNVVGPQFNDLHKFLDAQYNELNGIVDEVAEFIRAHGGRSLGTLAEFLKHTRRGEAPEEYPDARSMIADLLGDHEALIRHMRVDLQSALDRYHDAGTNNFLTDLMERHEKMAWMLRAFLQ